MIGPQLPAGTIGIDAEPVLHLQMSAQGLDAKPAFMFSQTHPCFDLPCQIFIAESASQ
jgi:hypothetical protein